ncbi:hypothetical protein M422DRAFT_262855 [Sphaerobolus stellatus SS14]|uniref:Large ribosomal subunit protein uL30 N-terminal eukaryotes domain-containing protein n=1 Tax=Sphaerobolus stellatus (strain SS14) TaxID=990650 RepID=A0A0C9VC76_SPHS4|nr:hypothetical protein M422DRAFT_262855 [Sphaerobolus stellatus SS14]
MTFYEQSNLEFTVLMLLLPCSTSSRPCRPFRFGVSGSSAIAPRSSSRSAPAIMKLREERLAAAQVARKFSNGQCCYYSIPSFGTDSSFDCRMGVLTYPITATENCKLILKRVESYVKEYHGREQEVIRLKRVTLTAGGCYVPTRPMAFSVVRIRGCIKAIVGMYDILFIEDPVNEIYTVDPNFTQERQQLPAALQGLQP